MKVLTHLREFFLTKSGEVYIADTGAKTVFRFKKVNETKYEFVRRYDRPTAPIFADTNYEPSKVAVDSGNNLYIVSEGVYAGIIQLANSGDFLGYFASNKSKLTPQQVFLKIIYTKEQEKKLNFVKYFTINILKRFLLMQKEQLIQHVWVRERTF